MELLDGITLKQYMQKKGDPLNWREALHFITQIMKALSHAHSRGIIHRDIKPQNIMVLRDGSVKVADFGIARLASAAQNTLTQEALGSVHYISPEQARGSRIDARSDIYSAGVVLYEMLTGRLPYEGDSPVSVAIQHINSIPLAPREHNPEIPTALEAITLKAMASNVEQRYVDSEDMLADLEEFRKNPNINFEYTAADLISTNGANEPTQIIDSSYRRAAQAAERRRDREEDYEDDREEDRMRSHDRSRRKKGNGGSSAALAVGVILIFIVGIGFFLWVTFFSNLFNPVEQEYEVPNLVGFTMEEIIADPKLSEHFTVEEAEQTIISDTTPYGQIVQQEPEAGLMKKGENLVITVTLSAGESAIAMPKVTNMEYRLAQAELEKLGLEVETPTYENSPNVTQRYVISTDPEAGDPVSAGDRVKIVVSLGPENIKVKVPPLTGQSMETVKKQIISLGLKVGIITPVESLEIEGTVVGQSFAVDAEVAEGTAINLDVSVGPDGDTSVTPGVSPDPSTSPSPSPSASPEPSAPAMSAAATKTISVDISGDSSETIQLRVECGGKDWFNSAIQRVVQTVSVKITQTGTQTVNIYINGELSQSYSLDFGA